MASEECFHQIAEGIQHILDDALPTESGTHQPIILAEVTKRALMVMPLIEVATTAPLPQPRTEQHMQILCSVIRFSPLREFVPSGKPPPRK